MKKHSAISVLAGIAALWGLWVVVRCFGEMFQYRYLHISAPGDFILSVLAWGLAGGLCGWAAIQAFRGYPGSTCILLSGGALFLLLLLSLVANFLLDWPFAMESKTTAVEHYGQFDETVARYLESQACADFLPQGLPEGASCVDYAYIFNNALRETFSISATVSFESHEQFLEEVERLKRLPERETSTTCTWTCSEPDRTISYAVSRD